MNKICSICKKEYHKDFFRSRGENKKERSDCKFCMNERVKKNYHLDVEKQRIRSKIRYHSNKEHYKKYREKNKQRHKAYIIKREYGISYEEYINILKNQNFLCSICHKRIDHPHIDHNHITGKVRGILCRTCNLGLGYFFDNQYYLSSATEYISKSSSILLTGAYGTLGKELRKSNIDFVFHERNKFDFTNINHCKKFLKGVKLIVHAGAFTDIKKAEEEKDECYRVNVIGTKNLASFGIPMLYISTEYIFDGNGGSYNETDYPNPQNFYAFTKLLGEYEARRTRSVVIRCLFKPRPFEHERACIDQFTTGDYVEVMAKEIALAVSLFDNLPDTVHIGSEKKSTFELARRSRPEVKSCKLEEIPVKLPRDTSLNCSKWREIKHVKL